MIDLPTIRKENEKVKSAVWGEPDDRSDLIKEMAKDIDALIAEVEKLQELVCHCWVHSGYRDCGYNQMDHANRALYDSIIGRNPDGTWSDDDE